MKTHNPMIQLTMRGYKEYINATHIRRMVSLSSEHPTGPTIVEFGGEQGLTYDQPVDEVFSLVSKAFAGKAEGTNEASVAMKLLRVINCMSFARYFSTVAMGTGDSEYWMEKFSRGKGNPFALLSVLDGARQEALWAWAKEESAHQESLLR